MVFLTGECLPAGPHRNEIYGKIITIFFIGTRIIIDFMFRNFPILFKSNKAKVVLLGSMTSV